MFTSAEPVDEQAFLFSYNEVLEAKSDGCDLFSTQFDTLQSLLDQYKMDRHNEELWTLGQGSRAESSHSYIKIYLGGKKTEGDLWESVAAIEAAINDQVRTIRVETNRHYTSST